MIFLKKSLGQNFLNDKNIVNKIINLVKIKGRNVIEIGPGGGALTDDILKKLPKKLFLIEKDFNLAKKLNDKYNENEKVKIFNADILKFDIEKILLKDTIIIGNLPYNISSQIFVTILRQKIWPPKFSDLIFMFQKELGDKIISNFSSKNYGRLSILTELRLNVLKKFIVSPNCFFPKPKVRSLVIHFKPKKKNLFNIKNIATLEKVTNIFFSNKRKMINKSIKKILNQKKIDKLKTLNLMSRPSDLKPEFYYKIAELLESN